MSIYVDEIRDYGSMVPGWLATRLGTLWCHCWTDGPIEELHQLMEKIGMKRSWFQNHPRHPHYDLVPSKRKLAIKYGAIEKKRWTVEGDNG